jgi:hypothetical protein
VQGTTWCAAQSVRSSKHQRRVRVEVTGPTAVSLVISGLWRMGTRTVERQVADEVEAIGVSS